MKAIWIKIGLSAALLAVLNGVDYAGLVDAFDDGKTRYLLLSLVPVSFWFFCKRLGWAPAFIGALALFSYVTHDYKPSHDTVLPILSIFACLAFASAIVTIGEEAFGNVLIASGLVQGLIAILQGARAARLLPFPFWHHTLPDGLVGQNTLLATFLVICLAPALWRKLWWAAIPIGAAVLVCHSVGGLVCLTVLLMVRFWRWEPWIFLVPAALALGSRVLYGRSLADSDGRFFMWSFGWRAVKEAPWFGSGIGAWENIYLPRFQNEILEVFHEHLPRQMHNDFLDFAIEYGLAPMAVLMAAVLQWIRNFRTTWPNAVCAAVLIDACFSFPAEEIFLAVPFLVCWSLSGRQRSFTV